MMIVIALNGYIDNSYSALAFIAHRRPQQSLTLDNIPSPMRYLFLICLLLLLECAAYAQNYDVRKVRWGMTEAQVMNSESGKPASFSGGELTYKKMRVGSDTADINYVFYKGKLTNVTYRFTATIFKDNVYLAFLDIDNRLAEKHGKMKELTVWRDNQYRSDVDKWGEAIKRGHLYCSSSRKGKRTEIVHIMEGIDRAPNHVVHFSSLTTPVKPTDDINDF